MLLVGFRPQSCLSKLSFVSIDCGDEVFGRLGSCIVNMVVIVGCCWSDSDECESAGLVWLSERFCCIALAGAGAGGGGFCCIFKLHHVARFKLP